MTNGIKHIALLRRVAAQTTASAQHERRRAQRWRSLIYPSAGSFIIYNFVLAIVLLQPMVAQNEHHSPTEGCRRQGRQFWGLLSPQWAPGVAALQHRAEGRLGAGGEVTQGPDVA